MCVGSVAVAEVMALIDYNKVIVSPVNSIDWETDRRHSTVSGKIRMVEDIIAEPISSQRVVYQIPAIGHPVLRKLLWAQNKYVLVSAFVILNDGKCRERLTESYTVCKNAAIVLFKLIDNAKSSILLKIVEFVPDHAVLEPGRLIWKNVLRNVIEELTEDIIECHKIEQFRRILLIDRRDHVDDFIRYIREFFFIIPDSFKEIQKFFAGWIFKPGHHVTDVVPTLASKINCRERVHRHIGIGVLRIFNDKEIIHSFSGRISSKRSLAAHPVSTLFCNSFLLQLIPKTHLKLCSVKTFLPM